MTEVLHEVDALGRYSGRFEAIASDTGYIPTPDFTVPIAQPQIATVISNTDPLNQGRITVKFDWQLHDTTNFIRMMAPDAGGTGQVAQNRGYVAIPEVGDQVMVGFVHNHPDRPFVMGGMFHGGTALGGGINNHMRSIQTKSGIKVLMNDDEKSVTILDPSGNTYFMDGAGSITVTAPKNMTFNAGENLTINVGKDMKTSVGNDNAVTIINDHKFTSKNYKQTINENKTINVTGDLKETTSTTTHKAKNGDILLQSSGVAKMLGKIDAKVNKG